MKKKFKTTKVGKILTSPLVAGVLKSVPFGVGSIASNVLDEVNGSQAGQVDKSTIGPQVIKFLIYAWIIYYFVNGQLTVDDLESIKDLITD